MTKPECSGRTHLAPGWILQSPALAPITAQERHEDMPGLDCWIKITSGNDAGGAGCPVAEGNNNGASSSAAAPVEHTAHGHCNGADSCFLAYDFPAATESTAQENHMPENTKKKTALSIWGSN
uniref:Uncharacterized protein n=1 Tax=Coccidioides posadasii RMSCC 3488 TaxID=454284 RepID=A0A0J6FCR2_COCPO|nr:hypothetical protein CPAG_03012 [Coccidioides posadasii RMSCC 3488]